MCDGNVICRFTRKFSGGNLQKVTSQNPPPRKLPSIPRMCTALPATAGGRARLVDERPAIGYAATSTRI